MMVMEVYIRGKIHMAQWSSKKTRNNGSRARDPTRMTTDPCPTPDHPDFLSSSTREVKKQQRDLLVEILRWMCYIIIIMMMRENEEED